MSCSVTYLENSTFGHAKRSLAYKSTSFELLSPFGSVPRPGVEKVFFVNFLGNLKNVT